MKPNLLKTCVPISALLLLPGCIDKNYDLSDIDKTTQINVKDLVVPVNVEAIELSNIIKLDDDSQIKITEIDGKEVYAVTQSGDFSSDPIEIDGFKADAPVIAPTTAVFKTSPANSNTRATLKSIYTLDSFTPQIVNFQAHNIDESIKSIDALTLHDLDIIIELKTSGAGSDSAISFPVLTFDFLHGLTLKDLPSNYTYDSATGMLTVRNLQCVNNRAQIKVTATALNFATSHTTFKDHQFDFNSNIDLKDASMEIVTTYESALPTLPTAISFDINTVVTDLEPTAFTGRIEYKLEGDDMNIDPVTLNDLPDILKNDKTDILLTNPQIYLNLNNPMAGYNVTMETGLEITSVRGMERTPYSLDAGQLVKIGYEYGEAGPYNYVISPSMPSTPLPEYKEHLAHVGFSSLSDVLTGDGLPEQLDIKLQNPQLPEQKVVDFELFKTIPGVKGEYEFFAPLALKEGSAIYYSDSEADWGSEDLDKMTITHLTVDADAFSDIPLGAEVSVYPIDKDGKRIPGVTCTPAHVGAEADGEHITMTVEGEIRMLDGIIYEAVMRPGNGEAISPEQTLRLENIRAKVSGYYLTDFE